jgi:hypothetical protein
MDDRRSMIISRRKCSITSPSAKRFEFSYEHQQWACSRNNYLIGIPGGTKWGRFGGQHTTGSRLYGFKSFHEGNSPITCCAEINGKRARRFRSDYRHSLGNGRGPVHMQDVTSGIQWWMAPRENSIIRRRICTRKNTHTVDTTAHYKVARSPLLVHVNLSVVCGRPASTWTILGAVT